MVITFQIVPPPTYDFRMNRRAVVGTFRRMALWLLIVVLEGSARGQKPDKASNNPRTVNVILTVADDAMRPVNNFTKEKINLSEDKIPREIESMVKDVRPASIAILLDLTGLVSEQKRTLTSNWISQFISGSNGSNEYTLIGYDTTSVTLCNWNCGTIDMFRAVQSTTIIEARANRRTALYDACNFALRQVNGRVNGKRVIVILGDGMDKGSKTSFTQIRDTIKQSSVLLYDIGIISNAEKPFWQPTSLDYVRELATLSGGWVDRTSSINEAVERTANIISAELRNQYLVSFKLTGMADRRLHPVRIEFTKPIPKPTALQLAISLRYRREFYDNQEDK